MLSTLCLQVTTLILIRVQALMVNATDLVRVVLMNFVSATHLRCAKLTDFTTIILVIRRTCGIDALPDRCIESQHVRILTDVRIAERPWMTASVPVSVICADKSKTLKLVCIPLMYVLFGASVSVTIVFRRAA
jgi:hypothetical protein